MGYYTIGQKFHKGYQLPIYYFGQMDSIPETVVAEAFRLIYISGGSGILNINGQNILAVAPSICCLNVNDSLYFPENSGFTLSQLYFHPNTIHQNFTFALTKKTREEMAQEEWMLQPFIERNEKFSGLININHSFSARIVELLSQVGKELEVQSDLFWPCRSRCFFLELLLLVYRIYSSFDREENLVPNLNDDESGKILKYIHTNYKQKITISELVHFFHTNKTSLNAKFKKATGVSIIEYLNHLRIQTASLLLRNTTLPINEIIPRVGFSDDAHFNRMFQKHLSCSPSVYRQKNCWMM